MTVYEVLLAAGLVAFNPIEAMIKNPLLKETIQNGGTPGWDYFYKLCESSMNPNHVFLNWHAEVVCEVAERLCGNDQYDSLLEVIAAIDTADTVVIDAIERYYDRTITFDESEFLDATYNELIDFLKSVPGLENTPIDPLDSVYRIPTKEQCMTILKKNPTRYFIYEPESRDCDDYMKMLRAWLAENKYGNLSVGAVLFMAFDENDNFMYSHAVNIFVYHEDGELKVMIGEPQSSDRTWEIGELGMPGVQKGARYEYYEITF